MVNNLALRNETSSESRNFRANILCKFVSKHGMLFLCIEQEVLSLPALAETGSDTKFNEMGEDNFGKATFVKAEEARDRVGEEGAE